MKTKTINFFRIFLPVILGFVVGLIIKPYIDYKTLIKPPAAPPSFLFSIAWTIIYLLLGISYYLYKKNNITNKKTKLIYYISLAINYLWSIIFFILKNYLLSSIWIIILDISLILLLINFYKQYKTSTYLNIPYLIWCLYATYLTIGIFILN